MTISESRPPQNELPNDLVPINRVLLVGGTHGNELTGVHVIKKFERLPDLIHRPSFEIFTVIGNPQAMQQVTRYVNKDLNRCFNAHDWDSSSISVYEVSRAQTLLGQYGPDSDHPIDLVIDLHSTTSNAGLMLILDHLDPFTLNLAAELQAKQPNVRLYSASGSGRENDSLRTLSQYRLGIEVGPIAHGTLNADLFQKTETLIHHVLDYVEQHNSNSQGSTGNSTVPPFSSQTELTIYQYIGAIDYPKDENGEMIAMIHPQRQFQDYEVVRPGDPMFLTFEGETIGYQGDTPVYPIFINEAAYYEKGIAMSLTTKKLLEISS